MKENTESVKVNSKVLDKVRKHVKKSKHTIGGFYDLAVQEKMEKDKPPKLETVNLDVYNDLIVTAPRQKAKINGIEF